MEKASGFCGFLRNMFGGAPASSAPETAKPAGMGGEAIFEAVREAGRMRVPLGVVAMKIGRAHV